MLQAPQQSVTFLNRVPVHLTVADQCKYSQVTLPARGLGMGSPTLNTARYTSCFIQVAGFYYSNLWANLGDCFCGC